MTREKAIQDLKELQLYKDLEVSHAQAESVLLALLDSLGYEDVVKEFRKLKSSTVEIK